MAFMYSMYLDGVLALGQGVPQLDGLVSGAGDDLTVVRGESNRHNVLGVVLEPNQKYKYLKNILLTFRFNY